MGATAELGESCARMATTYVEKSIGRELDVVRLDFSDSARRLAFVAATLRCRKSSSPRSSLRTPETSLASWPVSRDWPRPKASRRCPFEPTPWSASRAIAA